MIDYLEYLVYKISKLWSYKKMNKIISAYKNSLNEKKRKTKQDSRNQLNEAKAEQSNRQFSEKYTSYYGQEKQAHL